MTDTEAKALAKRASIGLTPYEAGVLAHYIEATEARHAAELREQAERFSEALKRYYGVDCPPHPILAPFIIPAPDPLVEDEDPIDALVDLLAPVLTHSQGMAARERENRFRNAIAALRAQQKDSDG